MSLTTGRKIVRRKFTEMPVTDSVIKQVARWARKDHSTTGVSFMDKYGVEYKFDDDEGDDDDDESGQFVINGM